MDSKYLIQERNIYFVPVLRNRLVFAAAVRNALSALSVEEAWSGGADLICVSLPPSLRPGFEAAVSDLPKITQILAEDSENTAREVFSITPADAFVEAFRSAEERATAVAFVDAEIQPGNLLRSPCERHPDWLDDAFVDVIGIEKYHGAVRDLMAQSPFRMEPFDTWREALIAQRLRELQPLWRRILFVCDMSLVENLRQELARPYGGRMEMPDQGGPSTFRRQRHLNLTVLLNVLDDYPKLVELFNNQRGPDDGPFDKREVLIDEIYRFLSEAGDVTVSTRQVQTFAAFLNNIVLDRRRRCPEPNLLFYAMKGCLGRALAERLHCHLASYGQQLEVERVRPRAMRDTRKFRYKLDVDSMDSGYRTRECSPQAPQYGTTPRVKSDPNAKGGSKEYSWPPEFLFLKRMHAKIGRIIKQDVKEKKVLKFNGSVESGIEIRQTLRSWYSGKPTLYVRGAARQAEPLNLEHEPVLWLLTTKFDNEKFGIESAHFRATSGSNPIHGRQEGASFFISDQQILNLPEWNEWSKMELYEDMPNKVRILGALRLAWLVFGFQFDEEDEARASYGDRFEAQVPNHQEFEHPFDYGCIHRDFADLVDENDGSWLEVAVLTAFKYAARSPVVVLPAGMTLPRALLQHPVCRGKTPHYVSLGRFSREERDKLGTHYRIVDKKEPGNSRDYYARLMRRFWT